MLDVYSCVQVLHDSLNQISAQQVAQAVEAPRMELADLLELVKETATGQ